MMRHCMVRMFRHHARDVIFAIILALVLSLYLSCQSGGTGGQGLHVKDEGVAMETNSKNDRTKHAHQSLVAIAKASRGMVNGSDKERADELGGYGNILEGVDLVGGDAAIERRDASEKDSVEDVESGGEGDGELSALHKHLQQLEEAAVAKFRDAAKVAMVRGEDDVIRRDLPLYRQALEGLGFQVKVDGEGGEARNDFGGVNEAEAAAGINRTATAAAGGDWEGWLVLLCLALGDADEMGCLQKTSLTRLSDQQKINRIPGLRNILWRKDAFCYTMNEARRIPTLRRNQLAPLCWVMPAQFDEFLVMADALGTDVRWVFKSPSPGGVIQVLQPTRERDYTRIKQYRSQRAVVQQYFPNPLLIFGSPVNIRAYVLVTSLNPLRAYVHSQGLVFFRQDYQKGFTKIPSRTWTLAQFRQYLVHTFGSHVSRMAFQNMETVIVETLLVAEPSLVADFAQFSHPWEDPYRCENCFQLLGFDIIFNSTLHPIVVEVTGQPHLQRSDAGEQWASSTIKKTTVEESIKMLFSTKKASQDVAAALQGLSTEIGIQRFGCKEETELCLTDYDLEFLMSARRERLSMGSFRQLYPSPDIQKYTSLLLDLERFIASNLRLRRAQPYQHLRGGSRGNTPSLQPPPSRHSTKDLHPVLVAMETYYLEEERGALLGVMPVGEVGEKQIEQRGEEEGIEMGKVKNETQQKRNPRFDGLIKNFFGLQPLQADVGMKEPHCSENRDIMPYLATLYTFPSLNLTFDPRTTDYYVEVSYDQVMIQVGAFAMSCDCEARLEDKFGVSRPANFTLGLGDNRISVLVVDITHSEPWVLNTYSLHIQRQRFESNRLPSDLEERHAVCTLVQDCELPFLPTHSCGLRILPDVNWSEIVTKATKLPNCDHGDAPGQWLVPCEVCSDGRSCDWEKARWQPHDCQHREIGRAEIRECLAGKKIFFIGDSTNRGVMYHLMERVNGSLYEWDKTHDTKLYTDLNDGRTAVSFSYYPQFWLPAAERPVFDSTLYHLLRQAGPLANGTDTVVVVGGVHWLAVHHLNVLQQVLDRMGLSGVQNIVKGLGAGFHQPVDGIHCLTLAEQGKVYLHNRGVRDHAVQLGFDFVDTFNMTMARYGDFLEGKCACHFHKVEETGTERTREGSLQKGSGSKEMREGRSIQGDRRYHVTGRINAIYSEIFLGQICGKGRR